MECCAVSQQVERSLEQALTPEERLHLGVELGSVMVAGGLLLVGIVYGYLFPDQRAIAEIPKAVAALIVSLPVLVSATRGVLSPYPSFFTEQLVALAILACMATGDFTLAVLIPLLMSAGHLLEERSILGAQAAIEGLRALNARRAVRVRDDGTEEIVDPTQLAVGDIVIIRPGEVIPADGEIIEGNSSVDESPITGESIPREVIKGDQEYAGAINLSGVLRLRVTRIGEETALGRVLDLLQEAEQSKAPIVKLLQQYASYYLPIVLMIAGVTLFLSHDLYRAITVLIVSCPCALVLSSPSAMVAALAVASRLGILIKNTKFLEAMADTRTVVLDKTGTLTFGQLEVIDVVTFKEYDEKSLIALCLPCAVGSRHPASRAIVRKAEQLGLDIPAAVSVQEIAGKGVVGEIDGKKIRLGRREWLEEEGISIPRALDHQGPSVWIAGDSELAGVILLKDVPRAEAGECLNALRQLGVDRFVLLTGDRRKVAEEVGQQLGIEEVVAEVLPEQKLETVRREKLSGRTVMVVGDGVNDALALASGDVGVAMGAMGSDIALLSADVALLSNDLRRIPQAVELSRRTRSVITQNVVVGVGFSVLMLALASFGYISPIVGALSHNVGTIYVILNSARIMRFVPDSGRTAAEEQQAVATT